MWMGRCSVQARFWGDVGWTNQRSLPHRDFNWVFGINWGILHHLIIYLGLHQDFFYRCLCLCRCDSYRIEYRWSFFFGFNTLYQWTPREWRIFRHLPIVMTSVSNPTVQTFRLVSMKVTWRSGYTTHGITRFFNNQFRAIFPLNLLKFTIYKGRFNFFSQTHLS